MTGRVVSKPPQKHQCSPGWRWEPCTSSHDLKAKNREAM